MLAESFCDYNYDYARYMAIVSFSSTISPKGATYATAARNADSIKLLKDVFCMTIFAEHHRRHFFKMRRDEHDVEWAAGSLRTCYALRVDGKPIFPAHTITLARIVNIPTANLRRRATLKDMMESLMSYTQTFEEFRAVDFVDARIMDISEDMIS